MIICTSICANYLPKAMVLAKSVKEHNPEAIVVVCLLERQVHPAAKEFKYFDHVVLAKDLGFENFDHHIFKHSIVEASTSVKGQLFIYLMKNFPEETKFVYLDPDIQVLGPLTELNEALDLNEIVLTPHLCEAEGILDAVMDNELCALQHGVFNLGFLAIRRGEQSERFINWWTSRLDMFCYDDIPRGIFTDQKWMDLAPCFFDLHIFKHVGYNVAPWNLSRRKVTVSDDRQYMVNDQPLRFFHFSGFDSGANEAMINKYVPNRKDPIYDLRDKYVLELEVMGQSELGGEPWSYDCYFSGERVETEARVIYRSIPELPFKYPNPFAESNESLLKHKIHAIVTKKNVEKLVQRIVRKLRNKL
jgi:hypothetical protein